MKKYELEKLGVPSSCLDLAVEFIARAGRAGLFSKDGGPKELVSTIIANPTDYLGDSVARRFAQALIEDAKTTPKAPAPYKVWGENLIDLNAITQMQVACNLPVAERGALCADAHLGYGLPIGGVLATLNAVIPYAVGVDIACRLKMSVLDMLPQDLIDNQARFEEAIHKNTLFGAGKDFTRSGRHQHAVMDKDWDVTEITGRLKDLAWKQLGSSGGGNHYIDLGIVEFFSKDHPALSSLEIGRKYIAIVTHSGSRGTGAKVCAHYSQVAAKSLPTRYKEDAAMRHLAWLDMDTQAGQEYWAAMNLMGDYASANHDVIHRRICKFLGQTPLVQIENHHNFCWQETHDGKEYFVHRKGATPAGKGVLGVIPGSLADNTYVVEGKGEAESLCSASHGAGRKHGRNEAKKLFNWDFWKAEIERRGVRLLSAGIDEVPGVYKDISQVMNAQSDLVKIIAKFTPKIVKMASEGPAED